MYKHVILDDRRISHEERPNKLSEPGLPLEINTERNVTNRRSP